MCKLRSPSMHWYIKLGGGSISSLQLLHRGTKSGVGRNYSSCCGYEGCCIFWGRYTHIYGSLWDTHGIHSVNVHLLWFHKPRNSVLLELPLVVWGQVGVGDEWGDLDQEEALFQLHDTHVEVEVTRYAMVSKTRTMFNATIAWELISQMWRD